MVDFRYHVVSIVAVFLALAVGIVLGTYTINGEVLKNIKHQVKTLRNSNDGLRSRIRTLEGQQGKDHAFISGVDSLIIGDRLAKQHVVIVLAPGASGGLAHDISDTLVAAGATVTATAKVNKAWTDPTQAPLLNDLAGRLVEPGIALPSGSAYERASAVLAAALLRHAPPPSSTSTGTLTNADAGALAGFKTANFVSVAPDHPDPATMAVLVVPDAPDNPSAADKEVANSLAAMAQALDAAGGGAAVAGAPPAAQPAGVIDAVRSDGDIRKVVSTVDDANTETGRIRLVLALAAELRNVSGQYGVGPGTSAPVPSPSPAPSP